MRRLTFRKLLEAMRLNGYPQGKGNLWYLENSEEEDEEKTYNETKPIERACALGQAVLNLGVTTTPTLVTKRSADDQYEMDDRVFFNGDSYFVSDRFSTITRMNDHEGKTPQEIADALEKSWAEKGWLDMELDFEETKYQFANYQGVKL